MGVLPWPAYSTDCNQIEHLWDYLGGRLRRRQPQPANVQQLTTALHQEWGRIPHYLLRYLCGSMRRRLAAVVASREDPHVHTKANAKSQRSFQNSHSDTEVYYGKEVELKNSKNIEKRFSERRLLAERVCRQTNLPSQTKCGIKNNLHVVDSRNLTYCAIEKSGSTFWKRILKVLRDESNASSPFDLTPGKVYNTEITLRGISDDDVRKRMDLANTIMFVRDPFTRLFSGYLDKLFSVNPYYWAGLGRNIVLKERRNPSNASLPCGHDVTFKEFVSAVLKRLRKNACFDGHFLSSYDHCYPCNFTYKYIGKYETFKEDVLFIADKEGFRTMVNLSNFENMSDMDAIKGSSTWAFANRKAIEKCMPFASGLRRVWRRLQGRSLLDKRSEFPYHMLDRNQQTNLSEARFREDLIKAYNEFDQKERLPNRNEIIAEAYQSLDEITIDEIIKQFQLDFDIFGYSKSPVMATSTSFRYLELDSS